MPKLHPHRPVEPECGAHLGHLFGGGVLAQNLAHRVADELKQHEGDEGHGDHDQYRLQQAAQNKSEHRGS